MTLNLLHERVGIGKDANQEKTQIQPGCGAVPRIMLSTKPLSLTTFLERLQLSGLGDFAFQQLS